MYITGRLPMDDPLMPIRIFPIRIFVLLASVLLAPSAARAEAIEVWKDANCGCCGAWIEHMRASGFKPTSHDVAAGALARIKKMAGLAPPLQSCHTAKVGGYVVEGHVPAEDVKRLLKEGPDGIGLAVPGMPLGSPGMEAGDRKEAYDVLLVRRDGTTEIFSRR